MSSVLMIAAAVCLTGCASTEQRADTEEKAVLPEAVKPETSATDPYERFNRAMYRFNNHVDNYVAKPISSAYLWVTPGFLKTGVSNFFSNLKDINVVLNDSMQGKFEQSAEDTGRFLTNTTFGFFGFFDIATILGLPKHEEDFGQTLAVWGFPQGAYLVLPLLGPTTVRGVPGGVLDVAANPSTYVGMPVNLVSMLNTRANADGAIKFIDDAAIDPYVFTREAYLQHQRHLITDGKITGHVDVLPMEDDLFNDDKESAPADNTQKDNRPHPDKLKSGANSFDNATAALDKANVSLEEAAEKLDKLKVKRHPKHLKGQSARSN